MRTTTTTLSDLAGVLDEQVTRLGEMSAEELSAVSRVLERAFLHTALEQELRKREGVSERHLTPVTG